MDTKEGSTTSPNMDHLNSQEVEEGRAKYRSNLSEPWYKKFLGILYRHYYGSKEFVEDITKDQTTNGYKTFLGLFLVVLAGCSFTTANVIQKIICPSLNFWSLYLIRSLVQMPVMASHMIWKKTGCFGDYQRSWRQMVLILLQGLFGGLLILGIFVAVKNVPLGNASAIFFCTPIFTFVLAACMIHEPLKLYRIMIILFMMSGVILITRPSFLGFVQDVQNVQDVQDVQEWNHIVGYLAAFCVPILTALVSIWTRQLRHITSSVLLFWFAVASCFWGVIGASAMGVITHIFTLTDTEILWTFANIVCGISGQTFIVLALKCISPTKANVLRSFEVILNLVLQLELQGMTFFPENHVPGIALIVLAVLAIDQESKIIKKNLHPWI